MAFKDDLKKYLPEYQRNSPSLDQFLDAVGEMLDEVQTTIRDFSNYNNPEKIEESKLQPLADNFDIVFPRNLSVQRKRELIREAVLVYRSNGTERSLKRIFKLIGWDVTIDYCWTLNPDAATDVQYKYNGTITYQDDTSYTYNNNPVTSPIGLYGIIFGNEKIYSNGVYADLYDASGVTYPKNTIAGEVYGVDADSDVLVVTKAPYIRINVNQEDYDLFTQDYVDPETGTIHSYTESELYDITQQLINYFLEQVRPANVAILEIVTPFALSDTFQDSLIDTNLQLSYTGEIPQYDGTISYGIASDRYILGENFGGFQYGTNALTYNETVTSTIITRSYTIGESGNQNYIPLWKVTSIDLTVPSDATVIIYSTKSDRFELEQDNALWEIVGTYSGVTNQLINITDRYAMMVNITTPSGTSTIDLQITLSH